MCLSLYCILSAGCPKKSKRITLFLLNVCDYTSGNLTELNMNGGSIFIFLRQNYVTKTIAQINDCLFIYMKFTAVSSDSRPPNPKRRRAITDFDI